MCGGEEPIRATTKTGERVQMWCDQLIALLLAIGVD